MYLDTAPQGFYVDEAFGAGNITSYTLHHKNLAGEKYPIFSAVTPQKGAPLGFTSPTYLYIGSMWCKYFGVHPKSFRALLATICTLIVLGIAVVAYYTGKYLNGAIDTQILVICCITVAVMSPSLWQFSRIAWDPPFMVFFLVWGIATLLYSLNCQNTTKAISVAAIGGLLLLLGMYSYSAAFILAPIIAIAYGIIFFSQKRKIEVKPLCIGICSIIILLFCSVPLLKFSNSPEAKVRPSVVGLFGPYYKSMVKKEGMELAPEFAKNILAHYSPKYLWLNGDANLRHSTGKFGILSWADLLILIYFIPSIYMVYKQKIITVLCWTFFGTILATIPAAATWEGIPHALRSIAALPFFWLGLAVMAAVTLKALPGIKWVYLCTAAIYSYMFLLNYFTVYPQQSAIWFDTTVVTSANAAIKSNNWVEFNRLVKEYPEYAIKYHKMRSH